MNRYIEYFFKVDDRCKPAFVQKARIGNDEKASSHFFAERDFFRADFEGAWTLLEQSDVPSNGALYARNVEFVPGIVKVRKGFSIVATPSAASGW